MLFARPKRLLRIAAGSLFAAGVLIAAQLACSLSVLAADSASTPCFFRRDWKGGWKVTPDARTIYIPVSGSIYRLDLQSSYRVLKDPWAILSNRDSTDTICSPLDLRLTVSNQVGIVQAPIVQKLTRLTPEQVAALPKNLRP